MRLDQPASDAQARPALAVAGRPHGIRPLERIEYMGQVLCRYAPAGHADEKSSLGDQPHIVMAGILHAPVRSRARRRMSV